jgi:hypothetical protein
MHTLDVQLTAEGLLAAWRPQSGHLLLETSVAPRLGARLAARLRLEGTGLGATVLGSVGSRLHAGSGHRIELAPEPSGLAALKLLMSAAEGRPVRFHDRAPRLAACLPAVLRSGGSLRYMDTHSVSREGCRLRWRGPSPDPGAPVALRIGAGPLATDLEGVVRWVTASHAHASVGVALVGGAARAGWLRWLELVQEAGAPIL